MIQPDLSGTQPHRKIQKGVSRDWAITHGFGDLVKHQPPQKYVNGPITHALSCPAAIRIWLFSVKYIYM